MTVGPDTPPLQVGLLGVGRIAHHFAPEVARLKTLTGHEFSEWSW